MPVTAQIRKSDEQVQSQRAGVAREPWHVA